MNLKELVTLVKSDKKRVNVLSKSNFTYFLHIENIVVFFYRLCSFLITKSNPLAKLVYIIVRLIQMHLTNVSGIELNGYTPIGKGFRIAHVGNIIIARGVTIGDNCTIHQCCTLGRSFSGVNKGCPKIGNNVIIFPGAVIVGNVSIGDGAIVGANALVINDVPANAVVGGVPAKILSDDSTKVIDEEWQRFFYPERNP